MAPRKRKLGKSVHSDAQSRFCDLMIQARKKAGLTQRDLAALLSKPQSFVAKYEGGERRLDIIEFISICKAISVDPAEIVRKLAKLM